MQKQLYPLQHNHTGDKINSVDQQVVIYLTENNSYIQFADIADVI